MSNPRWTVPGNGQFRNLSQAFRRGSVFTAAVADVLMWHEVGTKAESDRLTSMNPEMDEAESFHRLQAGPPPSDIRVPEAVRRYAGSGVIEPIWMNSLGGLTYRMTDKDKDFFIKWAPIDSGLDLELERVKMEWAIAYTPVPKVVEFGKDHEGSWLVTETIDAEGAVIGKWRMDPAVATAAIGRGLRGMHDALPVETCPFSWSLEPRVSRAKARLVNGETQPKDWHEEFQELSIEEALAEMECLPPLDQLVVCHGDACAPNTLIDADGQWAGQVDLERLGVGDLWADLAIASWSTQWNYGPGWEETVHDSYGIEPDLVKIRFYRLLWDLDE